MDLKDKLTFCNSEDNFRYALESVDEAIIGVDTETTGLDPTRSDVKLRLVSIGTKDKVSVFDVWNLTEENKYDLANFLSDTNRKKIFHNAKFDVKFLITNLGCVLDDKIFCTMLASQLIAGGDKTIRHSLKNVLLRYMDVEIFKDLQASDWSQLELTQAQIEYAAIDSLYLTDLRYVLVEKLKELDLIETATIEMDCIAASCEMELTGFAMNLPLWITTAHRNKLRCLRMKSKIGLMLEPQQPTLFDVPAVKITDMNLKKRLNELGIPLPLLKDKVTKEMKQSLALEVLERHKHTHPIFPKIIKHSQLKKGYTSYGFNWLENEKLHEGIFYEDYNQIGTETGRFSAGLQTIPQEYIYRRCFTAHPGKILVWADYSQIELRILAELSQDPMMIKAFVENLDLHTNTAALLFETPYEQVTSTQRKRAKNLNFGIVYGIGPARFANSAEITIEEAQEIIRNYYKVYSVLAQWLQFHERDAIRTRRARTLSGRLGVLNYDERSPEQRAMVGRNGKNFPIQGLSADITKYAMGMFKRSHQGRAQLVHSIHDEIVTQCYPEDFEFTSDLLRQKMIIAGERYLKLIPVQVDLKSDVHWKKEDNKWIEIIKRNGKTFPEDAAKWAA